MALPAELTRIYTPPRPVISPNGHVKQYRVILDPKRPELTIDEAFDDLERREALAMRRRPDDQTLVCGHHVNLWAMPNGWWLADTLGVEGNRVQGETKAEAIELTELGIEMAHDEISSLPRPTSLQTDRQGTRTLSQSNQRNDQ